MIAPTGTIAFMMDCDTTGIEPDIALVKYKKLVGGGMLKIVNSTVPRALKRLGYDSREIQEIVEYLDEHETIEGAPHLADAHLPVFDCAFKPRAGSRTIHYLGHLKMMGAVQPFISGAISKTINMPAEATVDEIAEAYITAWKLGLKAVAIYRDGSQAHAAAQHRQERTSAEDVRRRRRPRRWRRRRSTSSGRVAASCPTSADRSRTSSISPATRATSRSACTRTARRARFSSSMSKQGSTISGLMDSFATAISLRAAVRRAAAVPGRQVRAHALRAVGLHQEPADPVRQVDRRLPVPMARVEVPRRSRRGSEVGVMQSDARRPAGEQRR